MNDDDKEFLIKLDKAMWEGHFSSRSPFQAAKNVLMLIHDDALSQALYKQMYKANGAPNIEAIGNWHEDAWKAFLKRLKACGIPCEGYRDELRD